MKRYVLNEWVSLEMLLGVASTRTARLARDYTARVILHGSGIAVPLETAHILWQR